MPAWLGSLRFRLTAFYTLLLGAVLAGLALGLIAILDRQLNDDLDARLLATADDVLKGTRLTSPVSAQPPSLDPLASSDIFIQIMEPSGRVFSRSDNLKDQAIPFDDDPVRTATFADRWAGGTHLRIVYLPIRTAEDVYFGTLAVATSRESVDQVLSLVRRLMLWGTAIGIVGAAAGGWLLAGRALRPLDRITATAAGIATAGGTPTSLRTRLAEPAANDEVSRLARTFNAMLDRIESAFTAQRRFLADASHELRTPLTAIRGNADVLQRQATGWSEGPDHEDVVAALDDLQRESARMSRLVGDLLLLARTDAPEPTPRTPKQEVRLDEIAAEAVRSAGALVESHRLTVLANPVTLKGDPDQLRRLVLILVDNALRHTAPDGNVEVRTSMDESGQAILAVSDDGEGIAPEHLPHIFERFYRADSARTRVTGGTGLGLAIARSIVVEHGGEIAVQSKPGRGSTFTVRLPART